MYIHANFQDTTIDNKKVASEEVECLTQPVHSSEIVSRSVRW